MSCEATTFVGIRRVMYKVAWALSCERSIMLPFQALQGSFAPASCSVTNKRVSGNQVVMVDMNRIYETVYRQWVLQDKARITPSYLAGFQYDQQK